MASSRRWLQHLQQGSAWQGLVEAYEGLRNRASEVVGDDHADEFGRLFPPLIDRRTAGRDITRDPSALTMAAAAIFVRLM